MVKFSIIIPIYNVAPYLRKCLESVLAQDIDESEYELILVDDGITDPSSAICDTMKNSYANIHVIHQSNQGLSCARNTGIKAAKGKYIQFVDADDYLESNVLGRLVEKMENEQLDVLRFQYRYVRTIGKQTTNDATDWKYEEFELHPKSPRVLDNNTQIVDGGTYLNTRMSYSCFVVQFMIRRELLKDCLFTKGIYYEDADWTPRMIMRAYRITADPVMVYNYFIREGSISTSKNESNKRKLLEDKYYLIKVLQGLKHSSPDTRWLDGMIASVIMEILNSIVFLYWTERKEIWARLETMGVYPISLHHHRWYMRVIQISPKLYCWLLKIKRTWF